MKCKEKKGQNNASGIKAQKVEGKLKPKRKKEGQVYFNEIGM